MLNAVIKINNIHYESTFRNMFSVISKKISELKSENMLVTLFADGKGSGKFWGYVCT